MGNEVDSQDSSREPEAGETPDTLVEQDERTQSELTQESLTLATSVGIHQSLVGLAPDGPQEQPRNLNNPHNDTFYHLGSLTLTPNRQYSHRPSSPMALHDDRFGPHVDLDKLEDAMECMSRALSLTANGHLDSSNRLNSLVAPNEQPGPYALAELGGREMVMGYMSQALPLMPDAHPGLPKWLSVMGASHDDQFRRLGGLGDLEKAIEYTYRALTFAPDSDPDQINRLDNLGGFHGYRFRRLGELSDLEKAMDYVLCAVARTPDGHPDLPRRLNSMGIFHGDRFHRLGELADTEKAVEYGSRALELTPDDHPDQPKWLSSLGASYRDRFQRLGELSDLEIALDFVSRAHILIPEGHSDVPHILSNLSASYRDRFQVLNELGDLEHAIEYSFRALALTPDGHPDLPNLLSSLGASHRDRFQRLGELNDLEKAIDFIARAIALTPDGHPDLPKWLNSLGESQGDRYQRLRELPDLSQAVIHAQRAHVLTPVGHPSLPAKSSLFARLRFFQSKAMGMGMGSVLYLSDTLKYFRMASQSLAGAPRIKFRIALQWAKHASEHSSLNCIEAYQTAIDLLPQFIWLGATTNQRYEDLRTAEALAVDAAAAAILSSHYALALEWVEHAR
ncbi:unnamed protein product [Rhizoctonia solani]|uniref:Uncharacterized protein n=1 Tax=Rhizoctonia solani TaxID=456999 RepID=A0A8H3GJX8_9AGAM|nr:unnamed protein product [Rhizoctonia solani]